MHIGVAKKKKKKPKTKTKTKTWFLNWKYAVQRLMWQIAPTLREIAVVGIFLVSMAVRFPLRVTAILWLCKGVLASAYIRREGFSKKLSVGAICHISHCTGSRRIRCYAKLSRFNVHFLFYMQENVCSLFSASLDASKVQKIMYGHYFLHLGRVQGCRK